MKTIGLIAIREKYHAKGLSCLWGALGVQLAKNIYASLHRRIAGAGSLAARWQRT